MTKMKSQIRLCNQCNLYTLKDICQKCNINTASAHPAKFSPDDKYFRYRINKNY